MGISQRSDFKADHSDQENLQHDLILAVYNDDTNVIKKLLEQKADINARNAKGEIALCVAAQTYNLPMIEYLIQQGADESETDNQKHTFTYYLEEVQKKRKMALQHNLVRASRKNHLAFVEKFLELKADINGEDEKKDTALCVAAKNMNQVMVYSLIQKGASISKVNGKNLTSHQILLQEKEERNKEIIQSATIKIVIVGLLFLAGVVGGIFFPPLAALCGSLLSLKGVYQSLHNDTLSLNQETTNLECYLKMSTSVAPEKKDSEQKNPSTVRQSPQIEASKSAVILAEKKEATREQLLNHTQIDEFRTSLKTKTFSSEKTKKQHELMSQIVSLWDREHKQPAKLSVLWEVYKAFRACDLSNIDSIYNCQRFIACTLDNPQYKTALSELESETRLRFFHGRCKTLRIVQNLNEFLVQKLSINFYTISDRSLSHQPRAI